MFYKDAQLGMILDKLKSEMQEGLISCLIIKRSNKELLASYNSQENMIPLFHNITSFLEHALIAASFPRLSNSYKIYLKNNIVLINFLIKDIQISLVANGDIANLGLIEQITLPEIREVLLES